MILVVRNMPKRLEIGKRMDDLVQKIGAILEGTKGLAQQAVKQYSVEVESIIRERDRNPQRIEQCLDSMLGFCFDDGMLLLYKKLCRYYYYINPEATVFYVNSYREMWDEKESKEDEINQ
jgi:hypothetical protein